MINELRNEVIRQLREKGIAEKTGWKVLFFQDDDGEVWSTDWISLNDEIRTNDKLICRITSDEILELAENEAYDGLTWDEKIDQILSNDIDFWERIEDEIWERIGG